MRHVSESIFRVVPDFFLFFSLNFFSKSMNHVAICCQHSIQMLRLFTYPAGQEIIVQFYTNWYGHTQLLSYISSDLLQSLFVLVICEISTFLFVSLHFNSKRDKITNFVTEREKIHARQSSQVGKERIHAGQRSLKGRDSMLWPGYSTYLSPKTLCYPY